MGQLPSDTACRNAMAFLLSRRGEAFHTELSGVKGVHFKDLGLEEAEEDCGAEVLHAVCDGDVYRVEVRLPSGVRAEGACRRSSQQARIKAIWAARRKAARSARREAAP